MNFKIDRLLNHWTLLTINILIVIYVELASAFVARTGLVHLIAVIFIILGIARMLDHRHVRDQFLEPLIHYGIIALIVLAASHVTEFLSFGLPLQTIAANVVDFYLISLLIITLGVEQFFIHLDRSSKFFRLISVFSILILFSLTVYYFSHPTVIWLEPSDWHLFAYILATLVIPAFCIWRVIQIKRHVSIMVNFVNYFVAAYLLIWLSALGYVFEVVIASTNVSFIQVMFINHFLFYAALSLIFLAYSTLIHLGGMYKDIDELESAKPLLKP